ncbi:HEAT repeat domain-containing protein [Sphingomonas sp. HMP6]|uniref:HEAT repeat domain-containing protein n=1 Tax=Sphingomonas sp. HMP6 TaxID=1517551 RepID=UPI001596542E|nr:HEAT repeat domain-containing protein [Sphingomonas sp. HMP6]BCA58621.1 hypothetical protein HMP06_1390 [Sphingomonas sp. HMP6]
MDDRYLPASEFLNYVLADEVRFDDDVIGQANLQRLIKLVDDEDRSNRDWATFLISGLPLDSLRIRAALERAADDPDPDTRDEAIVGLARRDREEALQRLRPLLPDDFSKVLLEAAAILGEQSLVPALRAIEAWEGVSDSVREKLNMALAACEAGVGRDVSKSDLTSQHRLS